MKKCLVVFLIIITFLFGNTYVISKKNYKDDIKEEEIRGIYISYLEYLSYFKDNNVDINKSYINTMLDNIKNNNFNTIFLHVSPFSDAIYNSKIFPYSYTLTGIEGKNPNMDYLDYFIKESHKRNIKVHAWINPYRISNTNDIIQNYKILEIRRNEHFGDILMFLNQRSPLNLRVKSKKAEFLNIKHYCHLAAGLNAHICNRLVFFGF